MAMLAKITVISILISLSVTAFAGNNLLDIKKLAEAFQFPHESLKVEDYTETEKQLNTSIRENSAFKEYGLITSENLILSYKITSTKPYTFYPLIVTVAKKGSYYTPEVLNSMEVTGRLPEVSYLKGGRLPYGDFPITAKQKAFLCMGKIIIPDEPVESNFDPPGVTRIVGGWPIEKPATISYLQVNNSDIEIKISLQYTFSVPEELKKVEGGESYHQNFVDFDAREALIESSDPSVIVLTKLFRVINEVALEAPALTPFLKKESTLIPQIEDEFNEPEEITETKTKLDTAWVPQSQPSETSWRWLVGFFILAALIGSTVKRYYSKRVGSR